MTTHLLVIDAGTGSGRAVIFDRDGNQIGFAQEEWRHLPEDGRSRLDGIRCPGRLGPAPALCRRGACEVRPHRPRHRRRQRHQHARGHRPLRRRRRRGVGGRQRRQPSLGGGGRVEGALGRSRARVLRGVGRDLRARCAPPPELAPQAPPGRLRAGPDDLDDQRLDRRAADRRDRRRTDERLHQWSHGSRDPRLVGRPHRPSRTRSRPLPARRRAGHRGRPGDPASPPRRPGLAEGTPFVAGGGDVQMGSVGLGVVGLGDAAVLGGTFWQQVVNIPQGSVDSTMRVRVNSAAVRRHEPGRGDQLLRRAHRALVPRRLLCRGSPGGGRRRAGTHTT